ncbi:hypothetical protein MVEN_01662200 [Mycena venus]|uniref:Uncharacterized protein n=1 Tax=Mycena venus TaxID=2733690 RepID=A0A8H7CP57_9AGAR|nr:hypothetical protein MVEN_01662200 [Mycena venus]
MALYAKLLSLSQTFANPPDLPTFLALRAPDARHYWGHNYLVSKNPTLKSQDNVAFKAHLHSAGHLLETLSGEVTDIMIDEHTRKATLRMSYFLKAKGSDETVENDLIWVLKFTEEGEVDGGVDGILIKESTEFVDAAARARLGVLLAEMHGDLGSAFAINL